jgi:hypothetical protein
LSSAEKKIKKSYSLSKCNLWNPEDVKTKRLLDDKAILPKWAHILDPTHWQEDVDSYLTFGEKEIGNLSKRLWLKTSFSTVPVSFSECQRGFSQMNLIVTPSRSLLLNTMPTWIIRIIESPDTQFDPTKYVQSCLLCGWHSATATENKQQSHWKHDADLKRL